MATTGIVIDERYLDHETGQGHPERPARIATLLNLVAERGDDFVRIEPRPATGEELALVHDGAYVEEVARTRGRDGFAFDADTPVSALSYDTALLAAGGFMELLDRIVAADVDNGFAMVRPPGHHAERSRAMGFCLFNNVAVGAAHLRARHGLERILIMDWDVHHGNGTQHAFEADPGVLFVSTHQYPFYPGTGALEESGLGDGEGYTVNLPLPGGAGDAVFLDGMRRVIEPIVHHYEPEFILISAGFDAHEDDPLGALQVTEQGFRELAASLLGLARTYCGGRCAAILEGGYDLQAIRSSTEAVLDVMRQGIGSPAPVGVEPQPVVERILAHQRRYWRL